MYIKNPTPDTLVDTLQQFQSEHLECVATTTRVGAMEMTVVSAYAPPNQDWDPAELCAPSVLSACTTRFRRVRRSERTLRKLGKQAREQAGQIACRCNRHLQVCPH